MGQIKVMAAELPKKEAIFIQRCPLSCCHACLLKNACGVGLEHEAKWFVT
jgi:hypothetical protein